MSSGEVDYARRLWMVIGILALARLVAAALLGLSPDEAYYWAWSQQLAAGYYDHPPAVAWLIRSSTALLGDTPLGIRVPALLCGMLTTWLVFVLTRRLTRSGSHAFWVALLGGLTPILSVGSLIHTPDAALMLCWSLAAWLALRAFELNRWHDWALLGLAIGAASLSKGTGLALIGCLGLFGIACRVGRQRLKGIGPAIALLVAALVALPNLIWNLRHTGGSLTFQLEHVTAGPLLRPLGPLEFLAGQAGVVGPLLWIGLVGFMAMGWRRAVRSGRVEAFLLWCMSCPLFVLVLGLSLVHKVEANWPAVAYLAALPGMAWAFTGGVWYLRRRRLWTGLALGLSALITIAIHLQAFWPILPLELPRDPTARLRGWPELADQATADAAALGATLASEGYGPVSQLRFHTKGPVAYEPSSTRLSQYDLWPAVPLGTTVLFLQPSTSDAPPASCSTARERWQLIRESGPGLSVRAGDFRWWVCEGLSAGDPGGGEHGE